MKLVRIYGERSSRARRPGHITPEARLLTAPVFILSTVRSGSTLLRSMLGSHSSLYAPHELNIKSIEARTTTELAKAALKGLNIDEDELTEMLWDRLLAEALRRSGKTTLVEKTPNSVEIHERLHRVWPDARFIFLLRHPGNVYQSWHKAHPERSTERLTNHILRLGTALSKARKNLPGYEIRYEDLAAEPEKEVRGICDYLGIEWEDAMLAFGRHNSGQLVKGLGDWSDNIRSGKPQPPRPMVTLAETPEKLHGLCREWGYS